jgi:hypothetical protein
VLAVALAVVAAGCGGNDGSKQPVATTQPDTTQPGPATGGATSPAQTATPPVPPVPEGTSSDGAASTQRSKARKASPRERRVNRYLRRHFSSGISASDAWYGHVDGVTVAGTTTTLETDLADDRAGKSLAKKICVSVRGAIPGLTDSVRVKAGTGETLASCVP